MQDILYYAPHDELRAMHHRQYAPAAAHTDEGRWNPLRWSQNDLPLVRSEGVRGKKNPFLSQYFIL